MAFPLLPAAGTLHPQWFVDLIVSAGRRNFSGLLTLRCGRDFELHLGLRDGLVVGWAGRKSPVRSAGPGAALREVTGEGGLGAGLESLLEESLGELLPPEQIALCRAHAERRHSDLFDAASELRLLDAPALSRLRKEGLLRALRSLLPMSEELDYEFLAGESDVPKLDTTLEPALLIADLLEHSPVLEAYRKRLDGLEETVLVVPEALARHASELRRGPRQIIQSLAQSPESFETLRSRNLVPEPILIATAYALFASAESNARLTVRRTHHAEPSHGPETSRIPPEQARPPQPVSETRSLQPRDGRAPVEPPPSARAALAPTTSRSGSYRIDHKSDLPAPETLGPESTAFEPKPAPLSQSRPHVKSPQEREVESRVLDAWLRAVDDPTFSPKALRWAEKAADYFPKNSSILFYLGSLLAMNDHPLEGEAVLVHLLKLDPEHLEAQSELTQLRKLNRLQSRTRPSAMLNRWGIRKSL